MAASEGSKKRSLVGFEDSRVRPLNLPPRTLVETPTSPAESVDPKPALPTRTQVRKSERRNNAAEPAGGSSVAVTVGMDQKVRPSNVHVPVELLGLMAAKKAEMGWSNGELIISSIEATYKDLETLIRPAAETGGSLFAARRSRAARTVSGPLTSLNYRLQQGDFDTLDQLVERFGATSRGHLVTVALTAFLQPPN